MYKLELTDSEYQQFKKKAKVQMIIQDITLDELARRTGYAKQSIYNFFSQKKSASRFLVFAIAEELNMKGVLNEE